LRDEPFSGSYFCTRCEAFDDDPINSEIIVAQIVNVREHKEILAYGFGQDGDVFDGNGQLIGLDTPGSGLTCATFIIAFFASLGIEICDLSSWTTRPDDREWQKRIMRYVAKSEGATCQHIWGMRRYVGSVRFRPDEVAVSATSKILPLGFDAAKALAAELQILMASSVET